MKENWYEYLKRNIKSEKWTGGDTSYAFMHGEVCFACLCGIISEEQRDELTDMIPEY